MVFCDKQENIKQGLDNQRKKGAFILVKEKSLDIIFRYYYDKVMILDRYYEDVAPICMNKKCKNKILEHNSKLE